jgi:NAD(P)-dependent dehydrogenase (short-subunit alcohol dehydrogenase family)
MTDRSALVLGGTGMLAGCVTMLLEQGWQVVLPSRRSSAARRYDTGAGQMARSALRPPGHTTTTTADREANWVAADWTHPLELAAKVNDVLERPAELLVAWVHSSYRIPVMLAVAPFLAPQAPVVEVLGISEIDSTRGLRDPVIEHHPTQQVVLGYVRHHGATRWLTHQEESAGVLEAVRRALDGRPSSVHQVGEVNRWLQSR